MDRIRKILQFVGIKGDSVMGKHMGKAVIVIMMVLLFEGPLPAWGQEPTGREIMTWVSDRADGDDRKSVITMTLINKNGQQRKRELESFTKDYGRDKKSVMVFKQPADVKGTAFLSWDYDDPDRDDDKWLYMPALKKVRRISGSSRNEYFMGTDFTYDDMGKRNVDKDTHSLIGEEQAQGHDCWKIESIPRDPEDIYTRRVLWVSRTAHLVVQAEYHDKDGLLKVYQALDIRRQDGFWTVFISQMDNVARSHKTIMAIHAMEFNTGIDDELFRVSTIERGAIR